VLSWCGRASLLVKQRPVVRIRDLPIAGRVTFLWWRIRWLWCEACERTTPRRTRRTRRASTSLPGSGRIC
jgi:hypothetical protein